MEFTLTDDQNAVVGMIDRLARQFDTKPTDFDGFALESPDLERELEDGGYYDIASIPEMGPVTAAMVVERLAKSPYCAEVALSMLLRPQLEMELPRPLAIVENGRPGRFVDRAKTLVVIDGDTIHDH